MIKGESARTNLSGITNQNELGLDGLFCRIELRMKNQGGLINKVIELRMSWDGFISDLIRLRMSWDVLVDLGSNKIENEMGRIKVQDLIKLRMNLDGLVQVLIRLRMIQDRLVCRSNNIKNDLRRICLQDKTIENELGWIDLMRLRMNQRTD